MLRYCYTAHRSILVCDEMRDATIQMIYEDKTVSFSPFVSLKDGTVDTGEKGLNLPEVK